MDTDKTRVYLEEENGQVWNTEELLEDYDVVQFAAPLVYVERKSDGEAGTLFFQHQPRFYFSFEATQKTVKIERNT